MLFWTPHFSVFDSTVWLDSTLKIDPGLLLPDTAFNGISWMIFGFPTLI